MTERKTENIIIKGIGGFYYVETPDGVLEARAKGIFRKRGITPLAGDRVEVEESHGDYVVSVIHDRINYLTRPPVANVKNLFIVTSACEPSPNRAVTDMLTAIAVKCGILPAILVTKTDIADASEFIADYRKAGFAVLDVSADQDLGELCDMMSDGISVFEGNSGVGKSTLINRICPGLDLETAAISRTLGRGKHTTRAVELHHFGKGYIADTPGFSSVDDERLNWFLPEELETLFPEFEPYRHDCFFTGCSHRVEKGCAVLAALNEGKIVPSRHRNYCSMYTAAKERQDNQY